MLLRSLLPKFVFVVSDRDKNGVVVDLFNYIMTSIKFIKLVLLNTLSAARIQHTDTHFGARNNVLLEATYHLDV